MWGKVSLVEGALENLLFAVDQFHFKFKPYFDCIRCCLQMVKIKWERYPSSGLA